MVALKPPFDAPQMQQLVYKIIHDELPPLPEGYSQELIEIIEKMMCRDMDRRLSASELLQNALFKNHNFSKVEFFLPNKKTTQGKLSTNEDMDKTISDNTLRFTRNAREYDSYFPSRSTVSNSEIITLDPELPEAGGSETSSEDGKSFAGATESDRWNSNSSPPKPDKEENIFQYIKEDYVHEDETGASAISEENWHPSSYTQRQDSDAVLQQEFDEFREGKEKEKDEEERTLMDEKVQRRFQGRENNRKPENVEHRKPENVGHGKPRSVKTNGTWPRPEAKQKVGLGNDLERRKTMTPEGGQFELEALIGEGSYGKVFECFDKKDGKTKFAMKKISLRKLSADDSSSAETEARLLTSLQNEYILHVVKAFQERETLCIVTEFCDQGDLAQFLEGRKGESLDEERIVEWFRQICSALEYLHGRNVLHRDIRTRNIFLTGKEMTAKLGNFGLAKVLDSFNNEDISVRDNPYYMNPDVFAHIHYNSKTDIWALGVCVYEMVALKLPSDVPNIQQLGLNIFHDKLPPLPNGYSRALIEIIEWMMCRETERRPSALELLQNVLFKNHSASKALFLPDENTTREKLSTCQDMDKTISNNPEYENNLPSKSTVSNSESFDATTPGTELSNVSGSETSSENFERTMAADRARSTLRPPPSTFTRIRSVLRSVKDWMIGDAGSYEINCGTENTDKMSLQDDGNENFSSESRERLKNQKRLSNKNLPNEKHLYEYFWKEHSVFSQWYLCKFTVEEITYSSAEQFMMYQKAVLMDDEENAEIILALNEPEEIKKIGRHIKNFNQELWENYCLDVVEKGNIAKFSQNEKLRDELFSTYPKTLVEASPIDRKWGIGLSEKDKRAWNKETWRGQNLLGRILTKVRDNLMEPFLKPVDTEKGLV